MQRIAMEKMRISLNFDMDGVRWLDGYIDRMRTQTAQGKWQSMTNMLGIFLGECLIRNVGGQWAKYKNMYCVRFDDQNAAFPFNKVAKQFENGSVLGT